MEERYTCRLGKHKRDDDSSNKSNEKHNTEIRKGSARRIYSEEKCDVRSARRSYS